MDRLNCNGLAQTIKRPNVYIALATPLMSDPPVLLMPPINIDLSKQPRKVFIANPVTFKQPKVSDVSLEIVEEPPSSCVEVDKTKSSLNIDSCFTSLLNSISDSLNMPSLKSRESLPQKFDPKPVQKPDPKPVLKSDPKPVDVTIECQTDESSTIVNTENKETSESEMSKPTISRNKISDVDKQRIVDAYFSGHDHYLLGRQLGIVRGSVKQIVYRFKKYNSINKGQRGGSVAKISQENGERLLKALDDNPFMTLKDMVAFLSVQCGITCSSATVSNFLSKKYISYKQARPNVAEKNSDRVKLLRKEYVTRFMKENWKMGDVIYIDESSFNLWSTIRRGWTEKGQRLYSEIPTMRGPTLSLVLAIDKNGPIHSKIIQGSFTKATYGSFILELCAKINLNEKRYLIHDNAAIHSDLKTISTLQELVHLPPYSPFLNPIESVFSKLKSHVRRKLAAQTYNPSDSHNTRLEALQKIIEEELQEEEYRNLRAYFHHTKKYFLPCLSLETIYGD